MECLVCAKQSVTHETTGSSSNPRANTGAGSVIVSTAVMRKQFRESPVLKCPDPGPLWEVWALPGRLSFHVHWPTSRECLTFFVWGYVLLFWFLGMNSVVQFLVKRGCYRNFWFFSCASSAFPEICCQLSGLINLVVLSCSISAVLNLPGAVTL